MMGLATIDSHSQKEHTEIHKIPKFGVNRFTRFLSLVLIGLVFTEIQQKRQNLWHPDSVGIAIHFFVNFDIFK